MLNLAISQARGAVAPKRGTGPWSRFMRLLALQRSRADLSQLDDAALNDVGLSRDAAEREARRPFWDVPEHWLR